MLNIYIYPLAIKPFVYVCLHLKITIKSHGKSLNEMAKNSLPQQTLCLLRNGRNSHIHPGHPIILIDIHQLFIDITLQYTTAIEHGL